MWRFVLVLAGVIGGSSSAHADPRCGTPALLAARNAGIELRIARPTAIGFVDSAIYPIRVHYRLETSLEQVVDVVLPAAELSWRVEIEEMGWPAPPGDAGDGGDDRYDIYLTNEGTFGGAYTFGSGPDVVAGDDWYSVPSYIALDDRWIDDVDMLVFVAHELNHALQYTIDAWELVLFPWESTAEAITDRVDDARDSYLYQVVDFNRLPFASILFDGYMDEVIAYDDYSYYEYGGLVFATFLEERYGTNDGTTLLRMWEDLAQPSRDQEPDFLDALASVDPSAPTAAALYTEFAVWRMFAGSDDDGVHFEEAGWWDDRARVRTEADLTLEEVDGAALTPEAEPYELGTSYWRLDLGDGTDDTLHAEVGDADPALRWGLVWAVWPVDGGPALTGSTLAAPGEPVAVDIPLVGGSRLMVGVVNGGRPELEGESRDVRRAPFTLSLLRIPLPEPTTPTGPTTGTTIPDDPPDDGTPLVPTDEPGGCGCAQRGSATTWIAGLLVLGLRRRR